MIRDHIYERTSSFETITGKYEKNKKFLKINTMDKIKM